MRKVVLEHAFFCLSGIVKFELRRAAFDDGAQPTRRKIPHRVRGGECILLRTARSGIMMTGFSSAPSHLCSGVPIQSALAHDA